jgi:tetratricopeptide (TPR) repeat protein
VDPTVTQPENSSATPILDGKKPFSPKGSTSLSGRQIALVAAGYVLLFVTTVLLLLSGFEPARLALDSFVRLVDSLLADLTNRPLVSGAYAVAGWYCLVAVHELGHLAAGRLAGFKFQWMSIGPLRFAWNAGRLILNLQKANWQGGFTAMLPPTDFNSRRRWLFMVLGGAVANFVFAVALELAVRISPGLLTGGIASLHHLAMFSGAVALFSLVPYKYSTLVPDGSRILMLICNGAKARRWFALVRLQQALAAGQRYRDWDPDTVRVAASLPDKSPDDIGGTALAYVYESDRNNVERAGQYLEHLLDCAQPIPLLRRTFISEACFFQAWCRRDLQRARLWWERGCKTRNKLPAHARLREEAGLLFVEGKYSEAMQKIDESLQEIRKMLQSPQRLVLEQNWLEWKDDLLARQQEAQSSAHAASVT